MIQTHPATAIQAKAFTAPGSFSFPGGAGDLTPPSSEAGSVNGLKNGANGVAAGGQASAGNGVTPTTPAATPGATAQGASASGIIPTLQYVSPAYPHSLFS